MAQAIAETVFDVLYLSFALIVGLTMLVKGKDPLVKKAGLMGRAARSGDSFPSGSPFLFPVDNRAGGQGGGARRG